MPAYTAAPKPAAIFVANVMHDNVALFTVLGTAAAPVWSHWLTQFNNVASHVAQFLLAVAAIYKLYTAWKASQDARGAAAEGVAKSVKAVPKFGAAILAALGIVAVFAWLGAGKAHASPATSTERTAATRKRSSDDADGEADEDEGETADPPWLVEALSLVGTSERVGRSNKSNPVVVAMFGDCGHAGVKNSISTPWCAAFVGSVLKRATLPNTGSLRAKSYIRYGEHVHDEWDESAEHKRGDIVVLTRGAKSSPYGHVGFYVGETATRVKILGGNQGDAVSVESFPKDRVVAVVRPVVPEKLRPIAKTKTGAGAIVAAGGALGTAAVTAKETVTSAPVAVPLPVDLQPVAEHIATVKGPLQTIAGALPSGTKAAQILVLICAGLTIAGAVLAIYGRFDVRKRAEV